MVDLKEMTKKDKIKYIWYYYKIHIIVTLIILIGITDFIYGQITKIHYQFNLTIIGVSLENYKVEKFQKVLSSIVIKNPSEKQSAKVDIMPILSLTGGKDPKSADYTQKLMVELSSGVVDILILGREDYDIFQKPGAFLKLDGIQDLDLVAIKAEKIEGTTIEGEKGIYGINIENNKMLTDLGVDTKGKILCIPAMTNEKDKAILAIKWMLYNN